MAPLQGDLQVLASRVVAGGEAGLARLGQHSEVEIDRATGHREAPGLIGGKGCAGKRVGAAGPGRTEQAGAALPGPLESLRGDHSQVFPGLGLG